MRELPDDTKKFISDAIKSDSAPISCKDARKKKGKKGVVKSAAVIALRLMLEIPWAVLSCL